MDTTIPVIPSNAGRLCSEVFGLELPCSREDYQGAYRAKARELHPDNQETGDEEAFKFLQKVNDLMKELPRVFTIGTKNGQNQGEQFTTDGTPLYELGLGLGPRINGKNCPDCNKKGYRTTQGTAWSYCSSCDDSGMTWVNTEVLTDCKYCKGSGKFTQARSRRVVDCRACRGSGKFRRVEPSRRRCPRCRGTKTIWHEQVEVVHHRCSQCKGTGEVEVLNPVIPKGVLAGLFR